MRSTITIDPARLIRIPEPLRASCLLMMLPLILAGCWGGGYDDVGYGVHDPAVTGRDREAAIADLRRSCREGDRQSCVGLDRAIEQQRREQRYEGPQPSLSERNRDQLRRDAERREDKQRRLEQRPDDLFRR